MEKPQGLMEREEKKKKRKEEEVPETLLKSVTKND